MLHWLEPLITEAAEAPDSQSVLKISREILKRIDHLLQDMPEKDRPDIPGEIKDDISGSDFECADKGYVATPKTVC